MTRPILSALAVILLAVCLLSGGCSSTDSANLKSWKDLLKPVPGQTQKDEGVKQTTPTPAEPQNPGETLEVKLYFIDSNNKALVKEDRKVARTKAIARKALEELLKGPGVQQHLVVFPEGTKLLDINIKPEQQVCTVDFSSEIRQVKAGQEKLMVYAVANTLGQFPTIKGVSFMVNGQKVNSLSGGMDLSQPVKPDYKI